MKKKALFISVSSAFLVGILFISFTGGNKRQSGETLTKKKPVLHGRGLIAQGEKYEKEARYLEAKALYWKAMEESGDNKIISEAERRLYTLNMKILFSPLITEDSTKYTVVKGDSLNKIAKKFNATIELLKKSNGLTSDLIMPGMGLKVPIVKYNIVIDRSQNILILKSDDQILKVYQVSTGKDDSLTPVGKFEIVNKLANPTWYSAGAIVPPDSPENILGSRWMGISKPKYGIHGTTQPETIGRHVTAGCIRMLNEDVEELYSIVPLGTEVTVIN